MKWDLDRNLFTQYGLDSGALTMLGSVVHSFPDLGEYRGTLYRPEGEPVAFYITVDRESAAAYVNIDLAALAESPSSTETDCPCKGAANHFVVSPKGYVVFHVSKGSGGYSVSVRRATENKDEKTFSSRQLDQGDMFAASILRPGTYQVVNPVTKAQASVAVAYPQVGKVAYRPPDAARVSVTRDGFDPKGVKLQPLQGLIFDIKAPARVVISLAKPDDGPGTGPKTPPPGWTKAPPLVTPGRKGRPAGPGTP